MSVKDSIYATDDDLCISFEEYILSHYDECIMDRRLPCIVCKKQSYSSFTYCGKIVDCHRECLAFLMFYHFLHQFDVVTPTAPGGEQSPPTFASLYEMPFQVTKSPDHKHRCTFCGAKTAYFKCTSEACNNYYHVQCNTNDTVIAYHNGNEGRKPSYRFLLCMAHMNVYEIDLVKCRFHSKITLMAEYETFTKPKVNQKARPSKTSSASSTSTSAPKTSKKNQSNQKNVRERRTTATRSVSSKRKMVDGIMPYLEDKVEKGGSSASYSDLGDKSTHVNDYIACLVNEYGVQRRQLYQRNTKKFEWWPYDVLFSKIGPDLFGTTTPDNLILSELYKDLRGILSLGKGVYTVNDMKKIAVEAEPAIVNISKSMSAQLSSLRAHVRDLYTHGEGVDYMRDPRNIMGYGMPGQNPFMQMDNAVKRHLKLGDKGAYPDFFHVVNTYKTRPIFAIAKFGNRNVWFSCAYMKSRNYNHARLTLLDYIPIGDMEFEYFRRVLKSVYYMRHINKTIPVLARVKPTPVKKEHKREDKDMKTIDYGGFTWDLEPSAADCLRKRLIDNSAIDSSSLSDVASKHDFIGDAIKWDQLNHTPTVKKYEAMDSDSFVMKQTNSLVSALNALNAAIEIQKMSIKAKLEQEHRYADRMHEDKSMVEQYARVAVRMNRWSHFRWSLQQSVDMFNFLLEYESRGETNKGKDDADASKADAIKDVVDKEFCSVCMLSEQAYKQLMNQCGRCFMRAHYKCYASYRPLTGDSAYSNSKEEDKSSQWYCEPCEYEMTLNGDNKEATYNTAICYVCCSSGGALKRVAETTNRKSQNNGIVRWIHLHCAAFLMPRVNCQDWVDLSKWELKGIKLNLDDKCGICQVEGGVIVKCNVDRCYERFHITCALVSGSYIEESCIHNTSELHAPPKSAFGDLFPTLSFTFVCRLHTIECYGENAVKTLMKRRCHAYTHYLFNPASSLKQSKDSRLSSLPLKMYPSPVEITRDGPIKNTAVIIPHPLSQREEVYTQPEHPTKESTPQPKVKTVIRKSPATHKVVPQQQIMIPQPHQNLVMVNSHHGMMMNTAPQVVIAGGHPMLLNGSHTIIPSRVPTILMNGAHHMVMNQAPSYVMNPPQQRMMMMNPPRGMVPKDMHSSMMGQVLYGSQRAYVNEMPRYGVSAIASNMSSNAYVQHMAPPAMSPMEMHMQPVMAAYETHMPTLTVNGAMQQHQQYHPNGYMQQVQVIPKYWDPRMNQVQYAEPHSSQESTYVGMGGMGGMSGMGGMNGMGGMGYMEQ
ncbi:hypothetical protein BgAZ_202190 [Babesia gibsoni]|uniref:Zinc finger PHD-type domain-containing protein n=1 Tax=Babesia gibsoni TaxID=33632 RepID=A0AAD8PDE8_BABGI|nr:hypothetical protein BgAZ_202190 [Babesia gibsoni]